MTGGPNGVRPAPVITTLAEYQTVFWIQVARHLRERGLAPHFVSYDDRSTAMIEAAGFPVVSADAIVADDHGGVRHILGDSGVSNTNALTAHERFAFNRNDDAAMADKLARSIIATRHMIRLASRAGIPTLVQEVGGFLSVWGAFIAAQNAGVAHWFIEPAFFRGRVMMTPGSIAAPRINSDGATKPDEGLIEADTYLDEAIAASALVIPEKDRHQYAGALRKMATARNARRLAEKLFDKYIAGKRQEFGFVGHHVATHARTVVNSVRLRASYTSLGDLDRFVYYPFHVPGDMALTVRSPEYLDQLATVDFLARTLPDGYRLAVKEHPAMIGMLDVARLKRLLDRYPNLALIAPTSNNYAVMRKAEAVVTVNSKSGAEAGLLGRPVLVLGDAFYRDAPFARCVERLADLPTLLNDMLAEYTPPDPARVRAWFRAVWRQSYPGELYAADPARAHEFADTLIAAMAGEHAGAEPRQAIDA